MKLLIPILCLCIVSLVTVIQAPATPELVMGPPAPEPDILAAQEVSFSKYLLHAQNEYLSCLSDIDPTVMIPQTCEQRRFDCKLSCVQRYWICYDDCPGQSQLCYDDCAEARDKCTVCCDCEYDGCMGGPIVVPCHPIEDAWCWPGST